MDDSLLVSKTVLKLLADNCDQRVFETDQSLDVIKLLHNLHINIKLEVNQIVKCPKQSLQYLLNSNMLNISCILDIPSTVNFTKCKYVRDLYYNYVYTEKKIELLVPVVKTGFINEMIDDVRFTDTHALYLLLNHQINLMWISTKYVPKTPVVQKIMCTFINNDNQNVIQHLLYVDNSNDNSLILDKILKNSYFDWSCFQTVDWTPSHMINYFMTVYLNNKFKLKYLYNNSSTVNLFDRWISFGHIAPVSVKLGNIMSSKRFRSTQLSHMCSSSFLNNMLHCDDKHNYYNFKNIINIMLDKIEKIDKKLFNNELIITLYDLCNVTNDLGTTLTLILNSGVKMYDERFRRTLLKFILSQVNNDDDDEVIDDDLFIDDIVYKLDVAYTVLKHMESDVRKVELSECAICLTNLVDCVLVPCGHTVCLLCSIRINECHMCRRSINHRLRFYL